MKFLVFQHVPHEHPGLISDFAKENHISLEIIELWKSYTIPSPSAYQALIIMGGPMGVYEDSTVFPSKAEEIEIIKDSVGEIPILGFCLGSQLLAHALGAKVYPNIVDGKHKKEIGYYSIELTPEGKQDFLFDTFPSPFQVLEWHGDAFDLPQGAQLLATSPLCTNQAFSYKSAFGLLFHFEFTPEMVKKQIEIDKRWIHKDFQMNEQQLITDSLKKADLMKQQSVLLLNNFLKIVRDNL